jgi:hypothetical protein
MPPDTARTPCSARDLLALSACYLVTAAAFVGVILGATP